MIKELLQQLEELKDICSGLSQEEYTLGAKSLDGQCIGAHVRHIIEFAVCLEEQYANRVINYDLRKRDFSIESDPLAAEIKLDDLIKSLNKPDKVLTILHTNYNKDQLSCQSTYSREILYNTEHCIHHKAMIKVALFEFDIRPIDLSTFGLAPSTYHARNK